MVKIEKQLAECQNRDQFIPLFQDYAQLYGLDKLADDCSIQALETMHATVFGKDVSTGTAGIVDQRLIKIEILYRITSVLPENVRESLCSRCDDVKDRARMVKRRIEKTTASIAGEMKAHANLLSAAPETVRRLREAANGGSLVAMLHALAGIQPQTPVDEARVSLMESILIAAIREAENKAILLLRNATVQLRCSVQWPTSSKADSKANHACIIITNAGLTQYSQAVHTILYEAMQECIDQRGFKNTAAYKFFNALDAASAIVHAVS